MIDVVDVVVVRVVLVLVVLVLVVLVVVASTGYLSKLRKLSQTVDVCVKNQITFTWHNFKFMLLNVVLSSFVFVAF